VSFVAPNVQLIEQNFDYDLLTPAKLMEKAVGSQVRLVRVNPANGGGNAGDSGSPLDRGWWSCCASASNRSAARRTTCRRA
jgi:hypothetical protein